MDWKESLSSDAEQVLSTKWDERNGNVIPEAEDLTIIDDAVKIEATFLYADLAGSSKLARICPWGTTAKIIKTYLKLSTQLIRAYEGEIRSFDGDRVMGIFKGEYPNTNASKCAREIDWCVENILNIKAKEKFKSIKQSNIHITHCIGIDVGEAVAVRAGIRDNNDLIWIGTAPSVAAKLSDVRNYPYCVYITDRCYKKMTDQAKKANGADIWEATTVKIGGEDLSAYRTKYTLEP